jgi:iron-sulfur cluster repair protein YtfE (RIC family)
MVVTHRAIRMDLLRLVTGLDQLGPAAAPAVRARAIGRYTAALLTEIRIHHRNEERIVWPMIAATAGPAVDLAPLTDDHLAIEAVIGQVGRALAGGGRSKRTSGLRASLRQLQDMLDEHIADKEQQTFPAIQRYLPAEAYRWCEREIQRKRLLRRGAGFNASWLARYAQTEELHRLLTAGGWPAPFLLAVSRPGYGRLERRAFAASRAHP